MSIKNEKYCIVGLRPVKALKNPDGGLGIYAYNWDTKDFDRHPEYLSVIYFGSQDDVEEVTKEEFDQYVKTLQEKNK